MYEKIKNTIDRPIRPLIYQLNRIGLLTHYSCCGFFYRGDKDKDHNYMPYVLFSIEATEKGTESFEELCTLLSCNPFWKLFSKVEDRWMIEYCHETEKINWKSIAATYNEGILDLVCRIKELYPERHNAYLDDGEDITEWGEYMFRLRKPRKIKHNKKYRQYIQDMKDFPISKLHS